MRNIPVNGHSLDRLRRGVEQIAEKGGQESVVFMDEAAFLVSVKNQTVITAVDSTQLKNNVFTNIDSAVIV